MLVSVLCTGPALAAERYVALFEDGVRVEAAELKDWNDPPAQPRIADRALFDPAHPIRWIIDRQQWNANPPEQSVEFVGGDVFPGEVVGYETGRETPFENLPPHLLVRPTSELQPPDDPEPTLIRILIDRIRRVAWEHRPREPLRPGTVFLRNGGEITFRSLRWTTGGITLLVEDGVKDLSFSDLAEVHLPNGIGNDTAYLQELAVIAPDNTARIIQWDTLVGGRYTASMVCYQSRHWGDKNRPEAWQHLIQPAWSLDPLWLRFRSIHTWRSWSPNEPPLGRFGPTGLRRESVFSEAWDWQADRNTQGQRLTIGTKEFAGGFGVHATTDLTFALPELARELRVSTGLDSAAGQRGCVNLGVLDAAGKPLFQHDTVIGSKDVIETGWMPIAKEHPSVILRADMAATNRPAGADPFDIRDIVNWCDPQVRLDLSASPAPRLLGSSRGAIGRHPGLFGWTMPDDDATSLRWLSTCDVTDPRDLRFRMLFRTVDPFVSMSRSIIVGPEEEWLSVVINRLADHSASAVQIKIDGVSAGEFELPVRQGPIDPDPILIPTGQHRGKTVELELVIYPTGENSWIDWRGVALTSLRPGIRRIYEDQLEPAAQARADEKSSLLALRARLDDENPFTGKSSLRVSPGPPTEFPDLPAEAVITELPKLGQFRFINFAWRGDNTSGLSLHLAHDGRFGSQIADALIGRPVSRKPSRGVRSRKLDDRGLRYGYAYDAGTYQSPSGSPLRLNREVSSQWKPESRDLFGDFGPMTLTGFALQCHERGAGWFDHIYLARTPQDLDFVKTYLLPTAQAQVDATYSRKATKPDEWGPAIATFAPAFATPAASHGIMQKREHLGQADGWQTHPQDKDKPFILRTGLHLPDDRAQELDLRVSHQPGSDWGLAVRVNGKRIHEQLINDDLTRPQRGWATIQVDLSAYRGQKVLLEVLNESNDWKSEHAIWKRCVVRDANGIVQ